MTAAALRHHALVYDDDEDFVAALAPFVADGLRDGDAVVAAVTRHNIDLLRRTLGADAREVTFIDRDLWYVRPASTIAGWFGLIDEAPRPGSRGTTIAFVQPKDTGGVLVELVEAPEG